MLKQPYQIVEADTEIVRFAHSINYCLFLYHTEAPHYLQHIPIESKMMLVEPLHYRMSVRKD